MKKLFVIMALMLVISAPAMAKNYIVKMISDTDNAQEDFHNTAATSVPQGVEFFEGPMLEEKGQSWSYKFTKSGTYEYECQPHAMLGMVGMIVVDYTSAPEDIETKSEG